MKPRIADRTLGIGPHDASESVCRLINCTIKFKNGDKWDQAVVGAQLVINHAALRLLVQKAHDNKSRKSSDGALTVYALGRKGATHAP